MIPHANTKPCRGKMAGLMCIEMKFYAETHNKLSYDNLRLSTINPKKKHLKIKIYDLFIFQRKPCYLRYFSVDDLSTTMILEYERKFVVYWAC